MEVAWADVPGPYPSQPWCRGQHNFMGKRNRYCVVCGIDRKRTDEAIARRERKAMKAAGLRRPTTYRRSRLVARDGEFCQYCGALDADLTIDHLLPRSRGGTNQLENLVLACFSCNQRKGDRTPHEAGMSLISAPAIAC